MRRRIDDEDERPSWLWRLLRGIIAGTVVSGAAAAAISIFVLPPPAPPPPPGQQASADGAGEPAVIDGIEVSSEPAYFGQAETGPDEGEEASATASPIETAAIPSAGSDPVELDGPALVVNAEPFEALAGMPLVAVVIDDAGANPLLHETLFALDLPLTVGVVAGGAGDAVTAHTARAAGYEVVAQLPLAGPGEAEGAALEYGSPAEEAAERTELLMRRLPMAVAAARPMAAAAPQGAMVDGMMAALGRLGFAWLEHGVRPGEAPGVGSDGLERIVAVSRFAIPPGASATEAHAVLDRASAAAAENGAAVVVAGAEEPVLLALQLWAGGGAGGLAQLAPLSAVIRRQNGGDAMPEAAAAAPSDPEPAGAEAARADDADDTSN